MNTLANASGLMGKAEAVQKTNQILSLQHVTRELLLEIRDRRGWQSLGYASFEDYGETVFGYSLSYMQRLAKAAEIQRDIVSPIGEIPETHLRPLGKVEPQHRQAVYDHAQAIAADHGQGLTAKAVSEAVTHYQQLLEQAQATNQQLTADLADVNGRIDELAATKIEAGLKAKLHAQTQELDQQLQAKMDELHHDYQSHIDSKTDTIMRLQGELAGLKNQPAHVIDPNRQAKISALDDQIANKQAEVAQLQDAINAQLSRAELTTQYAAIARNIKQYIAEEMKAMAELRGSPPHRHPARPQIPPQRRIGRTQSRQQRLGFRGFRQGQHVFVGAGWAMKTQLYFKRSSFRFFQKTAGNSWSLKMAMSPLIMESYR